MLVVILIVALFVVLFLLIQERRRSTRKVNFLLDAVSSGDFTFKFREDGPSYRGVGINAALNRIARIMQTARTEAIEREKYYELIMNQVSTGILIVDDKGNVLQCNREARQLLGLEILTHTKQMSRIDEHLEKIINNIRPGEKTRATILNERGNVDLSIRASAANLKSKKVRIVALSDINKELDDNQMESWNKLIRVLTHEIMNTVTPISSLSETLLKKLASLDRLASLDKLASLASLDMLDMLDRLDRLERLESLDNPDNLASDLSTGLAAIHQTSLDLLNFVENYRRLTHLPTPAPKPFYVLAFCERMKQIAQEQHQADGISIDINVKPKDLLVYADEGLIAHVVTNLLKNAIQAITTGGTGGYIWMSAFSNEAEAVVIDITNDGPLIPQEVAEHIFVPFFTTKQNGSGIGLSVSRQIMKLSGGTLTLKSDVKRQLTTFELTFL